MKIKNTKVDSAPVYVLQVTKGGNVLHELRQFWSVNAGTYGHQIAQQEWHNGEYSEYKTSGCGYCKEQAGLDAFLSNITGTREHPGGNVGYFLHDNHVGGNFYRISISALKKRFKK